MNKILKTGLIVGLLLAVFAAGYTVPFIKPYVPITSPSIVEPKPLPYGSESYIKDGVLYTSVTAVPLACITKVTIETDPVMYVIIEYTYTKTHSGMLAMSFMEYKRLFGDPYA